MDIWMALAEKEDMDSFMRGGKLEIGLDPGGHGHMWPSEGRVRLGVETWSPWHQVYGKPGTGQDHLRIKGRWDQRGWVRPQGPHLSEHELRRSFQEKY